MDHMDVLRNEIVELIFINDLIFCKSKELGLLFGRRFLDKKRVREDGVL